MIRTAALAAALPAAILAVWPAQPLAAAEQPEAASLRRIPERLPGAPPFPDAVRRELAAALAARPEGTEPRTRNREADGTPTYTNRLLLETSPYLRQHAHNPVNWFAWGEKPFELARRLGRPVLVSIGYSTCHWCHVMEEESFDDPEIAQLLNAHFVAIKVDREVRPDIDSVYMAALQAMTGNGGWPANVFVTPDRRPFYAGTYFPPEDRAGRPGLKTVLKALHEQYTSDPDRFTEFAARVEAAIREDLAGSPVRASQVPDAETLVLAARQVLDRIDPEWGGIGPRPKFPGTVPLRFLLRYQRRSGDERALRLAALTLEKMAAGGIYDHVGGGFHRYSTDDRWLVPHFEKMLYDNALLAVAYTEAWQATGRADFARVARETLDYLEREMRTPRGGFASATDADSATPGGESEEGYFFTWTPAELDAALGKERARIARAWWGVTAEGNFEGRTVLHAWRTPAAVAGELALDPAALERELAAIRRALYDARARRPAPLRDDKVLAAWNGLAISAFARAGFALDEPRYREIAARTAAFVLDAMRVDGRLVRVWQDGRAGGPAFLEDYAFLIAGLLDLYESAPDPRWLREAKALQAVLDRHYAHAEVGGYYQAADDQEQLLVREKPIRDGAVPSGNSASALNLLRLAEYSGDDSYRERAALLFSAFHDRFVPAPSAFGELLLALDYHLDAPKEIVVVRAPGHDGGGEALLAPLRAAFVPNRILAVVTQGDDLEAHTEMVPLVRYKRAQGGRATAYVCENRVCDMPTSDPGVLAEQLAETRALTDGDAP